MLSDFSAMAKRAEAQITIPSAPLDRIRQCASSRRQRGKVRTLVFSAVITLAMAGTAAAFGVYSGVQVWFSGNKAAIVVQSFAMVNYPKEADLRAVLSRATFPVVLPAGLPAGTHLWRLQYAPSDHPNAIFLEYRNDAVKFRADFALFDSAAVNAGSPPSMAMTQPGGIYKWQSGRETVVVLKRAIHAADAKRISGAMLHATPAETLAATLPMLSTATIMDKSPHAGEVAARYVPAIGRTFVLGPHYPGEIARLAKRDKPLLDSRTVFLTNIPPKNGQPDYANATLKWPHVVAIPANGVRAIDAVYRAAHIAGNCACMTFFNEKPGAPTYRVWILHGTPPSATLHKYTVDGNTLAVTGPR